MVKHHARLAPNQVAMLPGGAAGVKAKCKAYDDALRANQRFFGKVLLRCVGGYMLFVLKTIRR